ncbi:MAG: DNA translocase FtsK 4TM domain-containing protein, partial [Salinivirgaceae bacterium]|nr:DNA translocase FtsK 4TM domain-containing protein [Salinivirgaceae bacterium]
MAKKVKTDNKKQGKTINRVRDRRVPTVLGLFFIGVSAILTVSFISFLITWRSDSMLVDMPIGELISDTTIVHSNLMGKAGVILSTILIPRWVGLAAFCIIPIFFLIGARFFGKRVLPFRTTTIRLLVLMFWLSFTLGFLFDDRYYLIAGAHGHYISRWVESMFGVFGATFTIIFFAIVIVAFLFESTFAKIVSSIKNVYISYQERRAFALASKQQNAGYEQEVEDVYEDVPLENEIVESEPLESAAEKTKSEDGYTFLVETQREPEEEVDDIQPTQAEQYTINEDEFDDELPSEPINPHEATNNLLEIELIDQEESVEEIVPVEFVASVPTVKKVSEKEDSGVGFEVEKNIEEEATHENLHTIAEGKFDPKLDLSIYQYPTLSLLPKIENGGSSVNDAELQSNKDKIVETLANYGIK